MTISRRDALLSAIYGTGLLGLRALATGLPATFLANPRKAIAGVTDAGCGPASKAQYIIFNTLGSGDPINANVPGTYSDPNVVHSLDPSMAPTALTLAGTQTTAAAPWAKLPQSVLDRTTFWHLMTDTPIHPREPDVLELMGASPNGEMLPSLLSKALASCLGTVQMQPVTVAGQSLKFDGANLPVIPALALKATLASAPGPLTKLQGLRDQTLNQLYDLYKNDATPAQRTYIDSMVTSQSQIRNVNQQLLGQLASIKDNSAASQVLAAITLIQMNVTPVVSLAIPFGGDNHRDIGLAAETAQTVSGVATMASMMAQLQAAGLQDKVTFMSLNVFGRTIGPGNTDGRQHNSNHQVSITIGKPFKGGIVGAIAPMHGDYGAVNIDSKTGAGTTSGDINAVDSLAAFGKTMLAAVGADPSGITSPTGTVIQGALSST